MNQKVLLKNQENKTVYCVVSCEETLEQALGKVFDIKPGYGLAVSVSGQAVRIADYFRADTLAQFELLSVSPTDEPLRYQLTSL